jgi:hypothetical protein
MEAILLTTQGEIQALNKFVTDVERCFLAGYI